MSAAAQRVPLERGLKSAWRASLRGAHFLLEWGMGLRERKKQETRAALSWAAIRLVVERGADNVLVEDIAAAAGVSPRTFNNYFSSKGEAIASRHLDRCLRMAEELRTRPPSEPLWEAITRASLDQLEPGPEVNAHPVPDRDKWVAGLRLAVAAPSLQADMIRAGVRAEAEVAAAVAARTGTDVDRDLYPRLVAASIMAAINVATQLWLGGGATADMGALLTESLRQIAAGLPPPREQAAPPTTDHGPRQRTPTRPTTDGRPDNRPDNTDS